jgi:hypothetical protein
MRIGVSESKSRERGCIIFHGIVRQLDKKRSLKMIFAGSKRTEADSRIELHQTALREILVTT